MPVEDRALAGLLRSQPNLQVRGAEPPEFSDLDSVNLAIASHALQGFWVNAEQLRCFIAVEKGLEDKFRPWSGLAGRGSEPRWLGSGHDELLEMSTKRLGLAPLPIFRKRRFSFSQVA
jgi:hypothetical protein